MHTEATVKRIDFRGHLRGCLPQLLWQGLFDIYRKHGCQIDRMDNMLIDLNYCKDVFEKLFDKDEVEFFWGCWPGGWMTAVEIDPSISEHLFSLATSMDVVVSVKVTKDYAELKELVLNDDE